MTGGGRYPLVMLTRDDVRRIALAQPEAYEADHHGMPSFRVGKKIFCTIHQDHPRAMLKLDPEDQHNLSEAHPGVVELVPGYGVATARPLSGSRRSRRRDSPI